MDKTNPDKRLDPGFFIGLRPILLFLVSLCSVVTAEAATYKITPRCKAAYDHIMNLELPQARQELLLESRENPANLMPVLFHNYADFVSIFTKENPSLYQKLYNNKEARLDQLNETGKRDSPYHRYVKAEILLQWAFLEIKFKDYLSALWDFRKAYLLLKENKAQHPGFQPNNKNLGLLHALIGTVPDQYRWAVQLAGMEGDIEKGLRQLEKVLSYGQQNNFLFRRESVIYYSALQLHIVQDKDTAWQVITEANLPDTSRLMTYFAAANTALFTAHNEKALQWLADSRWEASGKGFPYLHFLYGIAKLQNLATDADDPFHTFLAHYKGKDHIKESLQKIAWYHLVKGDSSAYRKYLAKAKDSGRTMVDGDKQAQREIDRGVTPHPVLLRARLLSDGGYYERADSLLAPYQTHDFAKKQHRIAFIYRQARIFDEWHKLQKAIDYYMRTIEMGRHEPYYYAANAALHLGYIFRKKDDKEKALSYFRMCRNVEEHPYAHSINQKAKAAIDGLK